MKFIALISVGFAAALVSASPAPLPTPAPTAAPVVEVPKIKDCTTSTVKLQQFNNNMTSTTYLKTKTETQGYDCGGCHHITTSWIGWRPLFHHQPTTETVKKTTTTVATCNPSPTAKPTRVFGDADAAIEIPENELPQVKTPEIETEEVETPELDAQEFEIPEGVEIVDY